MGRILKRTSFVGPRSRGYRCRVESLESRSMMAADVFEAAVDPVPDEIATELTDPIAVDEWQAWDPAVCELQPYDFCELQPYVFVDPFVQISDYGDDGTSTWDDSGVLYFGDFSILPFSSGWTCTLLPSAYARGADVSESFAAYAAAADSEPAESVAVSPRSAAFADMGTMAAAATEMQASSADAMPVGRRRRR